MQIIGIYLRNGDPRVIKNLKKNTWYSFGNYSNIDENFKNHLNKQDIEYQNLINEINKKQNFINKLYKLPNTENININLNCILGKNGAGKSSLLNLEYRIINNFSCKINNCLPDFNQDYHPKWATGFDADLYYKLGEKIYCISVFNNKDLIEKNSNYLENRVELIFEDNTSINNLFFYLENQVKKIDEIKDEEKETLKHKESELLDQLSENFFYSIATNYSIYSNAIVSNKWNNFYETWQEKLYHKNDGYLTPIVLVPYKYTGATIDTKKELSLAEERVSTLSILVYAEKTLQDEKRKDFIENLTPVEIQYRIQSKENYTMEIKKKYIKLYNPDADYEDQIEDLYNEINKIQRLDKLQPILRKKIEDLLFSEDCEKEYMKNWNKDECIIESDLFTTIKENTIKYITFKIIKMCTYYDKYRTLFNNTDTIDQFGNYTADSIKVYNKILEDVLTNTEESDFTDLKIKQCVTFLKNLNFYFPDEDLSIYLNNDNISSRTIDEFIQAFKNSNYSYDYIFKNLLPAYFIKDLKYAKSLEVKEQNDSPLEDNNKISISALSSGESHLINSISYAIYHMKNASSKSVINEIENKKNLTTRIQYKNMNLVFDEAELYYHPEYQKNFISNLLGILDRSNLKEVNSINVTIVTHSPFILSDIAKDTILALDNGKISNKINETLGANIYDLLANQFFMTKTIGENSRIVIEEIISAYQDNKPLTKDFDFYNNFIKKIGDDYLKKELQEMIDSKRNVNFIDRKINYYETIIGNLKKQKAELNEKD